MARTPDDNQTLGLDLGADVPPPAPPIHLDEAAPGVPDITHVRKDDRLAKEFDLVRVHAPVYVLDQKAASARSAGAERVAKHRAKLAEQNMRPTSAPAEIIDQVKAAGGWDKWKETQKTTIQAEPKIVELKVEVPGPERIVEKLVEIPAKISQKDAEDLRLGRYLRKLPPGWKRNLIYFLLGSEAR